MPFEGKTRFQVRRGALRTVAAVLLASLLASGCKTPRPETMRTTVRDMEMFVDGSGPLKVDGGRRDTVAVLVLESRSRSGYGETMARALDRKLVEEVGKFAFFQVMERSNVDVFALEALFTGEEQQDGPGVLPADYLITAKITTSDGPAPEEPVRDEAGRPRPANRSRFSMARLRDSIGYGVTVTVDFRFYELARRRMIFTKSVKHEYSAVWGGSLHAWLDEAAQLCAREFAEEIGNRFAPPARVMETRGGGLVARISIGASYGLKKGMEVEFYELVDNSAIIAGAERDRSAVGKGRILDVAWETAWVEVYDHKAAKVRRGDYVGILLDQTHRSRFTDLFRY